MQRRILAGLLGVMAMSDGSGAQSATDAARQFIGTWRLVSWTQRLADGTTRPDPKNVGYLIYSDAGYMCYGSMAANRPAWASYSAPTGAEAVATMVAPYNAYCARVEVNVAEGFVLHHVEVDKSPNMIGRTRRRWFTFQGPNRVVFRIDASELTAPVVEDTLVWERVEKK